MNKPKKSMRHLCFLGYCERNMNIYLRSLSPGAETGRQAWLRAMCPYGREGSTPSLGTKTGL